MHEDTTDPTRDLSSWAVAALEREVDQVVAYDHVEGQTGATWRPRRGRARHHTRLTTAAVDARILVVPVALMFVVIALIAITGTSLVLVAVSFLALVVGVALVAELIASMTREVEHVSPETAALLAGEGVADPDRLFGDLLAARRSGASTTA